MVTTVREYSSSVLAGWLLLSTRKLVISKCSTASSSPGMVGRVHITFAVSVPFTSSSRLHFMDMSGDVPEHKNVLLKQVLLIR